MAASVAVALAFAAGAQAFAAGAQAPGQTAVPTAAQAPAQTSSPPATPTAAPGRLEPVAVYEAGGRDVSAVVRVPAELIATSALSFEARDRRARVLASQARPLLDGGRPVWLLVMPGAFATPVGLAEVRSAATDFVLRLGTDTRTSVVDQRALSVAGRTSPVEVAEAVAALTTVQPGGLPATAAVRQLADALSDVPEAPHIVVAFAPQADESPVPSEELARTLRESRTLLYVVTPAAGRQYWSSVADSAGGAVVDAPAVPQQDLAGLLRRHFVVETTADPADGPIQLRAAAGEVSAVGTVELQRESAMPRVLAVLGVVVLLGAAAAVAGVLFGRRSGGVRSRTGTSRRLDSGAPIPAPRRPAGHGPAHAAPRRSFGVPVLRRLELPRRRPNHRRAQPRA